MISCTAFGTKKSLGSFGGQGMPCRILHMLDLFGFLNGRFDEGKAAVNGDSDRRVGRQWPVDDQGDPFRRVARGDAEKESEGDKDKGGYSHGSRGKSGFEAGTIGEQRQSGESVNGSHFLNNLHPVVIIGFRSRQRFNCRFAQSASAVHQTLLLSGAGNHGRSRRTLRGGGARDKRWLVTFGRANFQWVLVRSRHWKIDLK